MAIYYEHSRPPEQIFTLESKLLQDVKGVENPITDYLLLEVCEDGIRDERCGCVRGVNAKVMVRHLGNSSGSQLSLYCM